MTTARRLLVLAVLAALVVAAAVVDRADPGARADPLGVPAPETMPAAAPSDALTSTWFCPGGTAVPGGIADLSVTVANLSAGPRRGTVRWVPDEGDAVVTPVELGPRSSVRLVAADVLQAGWVAATVELDGGGVVVEQGVVGPDGRGGAPCADQASTTWHVAAGATTRDAADLLLLSNPFPDDAIVDVALATDEGRAQPPALVGYVVEAGGLDVIDLGEQVRRQAAVAATVTARRGQLVVSRVQRFDGSEGRRGLAVTLGAPSAGEEWWLPEGRWGDGLAERIHVYNPTEDEAVAVIDLSLPADAAPVEPVEVTVAPMAAVTVDIGADGRIPAGVPHTATVRSLNGTPVVVERELSGAGGAWQGWASTLGARRSGGRWAFVGQPAAGLEELLVIQNPGAAPAWVSVAQLGEGGLEPLPDLVELEVPAAGRLDLRLNDHAQRSSAPVVVEATDPVVVERVLAGPRDGPSLSTTVGVPLAG